MSPACSLDTFKKLATVFATVFANDVFATDIWATDIWDTDVLATDVATDALASAVNKVLSLRFGGQKVILIGAEMLRTLVLII